MEILDDVMPSKSVTPDTYSYNTVMAGLSRVGDRDTLRGYLTQMTNIGITPDKYTVEVCFSTMGTNWMRFGHSILFIISSLLCYLLCVYFVTIFILFY